MTTQRETRISRGNQVVVPASIRRSHGLDPGDILVWEDQGDDIRVVPRKRLTRADIAGFVAFPGDAVELKRRVQRGGK